MTDLYADLYAQATKGVAWYEVDDTVRFIDWLLQGCPDTVVFDADTPNGAAVSLPVEGFLLWLIAERSDEVPQQLACVVFGALELGDPPGSLSYGEAATLLLLERAGWYQTVEDFAAVLHFVSRTMYEDPSESWAGSPYADAMRHLEDTDDDVAWLVDWLTPGGPDAIVLDDTNGGQATLPIEWLFGWFIAFRNDVMPFDTLALVLRRLRLDVDPRPRLTYGQGATLLLLDLVGERESAAEYLLLCLRIASAVDFLHWGLELEESEKAGDGEEEI